MARENQKTVLRGTKNFMVRELKGILREKNKVASGKTLKSIKGIARFSFSKSSVEIAGDEALIFIDRGRKKGGKQPPIQSLLDWIRARGIKGKDRAGRFISDNSLAFLIGRAIVRRGIKPAKILDLFQKRSIQQLTRQLDKAVQKDLRIDGFNLAKAV